MADVPESTIRSDASPAAAPGCASTCSKMRRHTAGMALNRVARHRAISAHSTSASARSTNTAVVCCCHAESAIVHAPMWNRGYMHTVAPRGSSCEPG